VSIEDRLEATIRCLCLQAASDVLIDVEREMRAGRARLASLRAECVQAQKLATINRDAANSLREELAYVVEREHRRSFWWSISVTLVASLPVGVLAGVIAILIAQPFTGR
jgi:hypothetical protein